jgi:hypothetical protein
MFLKFVDFHVLGFFCLLKNNFIAFFVSTNTIPSKEKHFMAHRTMGLFGEKPAKKNACFSEQSFQKTRHKAHLIFNMTTISSFMSHCPACGNICSIATVGSSDQDCR